MRNVFALATPLRPVLGTIEPRLTWEDRLTAHQIKVVNLYGSEAVKREDGWRDATETALRAVSALVVANGGGGRHYSLDDDNMVQLQIAQELKVPSFITSTQKVGQEIIDRLGITVMPSTMNGMRV